jgi:hypothetical protein
VAGAAVGRVPGTSASTARAGGSVASSCRGGAVDAASGALLAWNPSANSALGVFALAPVSGGPLVAGGDFTQVGGAANRHLALFG